MTEPEQPGLPPRIELDPHPEPPRPAPPSVPAPSAPRSGLPAEPWHGSAAPPVPWEDLDLPGPLERIGATLRLGFTDPFELSERVPATGAILPAWLFSLLIGVPATVLSLVLREMSMQALSSVLRRPVHTDPALQLFTALGGLLVGPLVGGAFLHLFLMLWGGTRQEIGLHQTIRFLCYAYGIYYLVSWIPVLNIPLGIVFWVFLSMGLARVHQTDTWRGFAATLTPLLACCCLFIPLLFLMRP